MGVPYANGAYLICLRCLPGGRKIFWPGKCRLSLHRVLATRKGLSVLEWGYLSRVYPIRGRARFLCKTEQGRIHRPSGFPESEGERNGPPALLPHHPDRAPDACREGSDSGRG